MGRWNELRELTRMRALIFVRQPEAMFWVLVFPMVLAAVLGFAFQSTKPAPSVIGVLAADTGVEAVARLKDHAGIELLELADRDAAENALRSGKIDALYLVREQVTLRLDPVREGTELARLRVLAAQTGLDASALPVDEVSERGSRYIDFLFPGLLGMNLMGTGLWSIGFAVADLRQKKLLKRLLITPMRRSSFLASFLLARLLFLALELTALTAFGLWVLDIPLRGGLFAYAAISLVGALAFAGLGLLASARTKTLEGASGMLNLVMMPMWLGSGVFFSYERFPEVIQPLLRLLPLTALNDALRATMLQGSGWSSIAAPLAVLLAWTVVPFLIAVRVFRWE